MQDAPFKIYNASAGSGKTHTLTKEYLKIVLDTTGRFKKILAITFTNKAVNEMKTRILSSLFEFANVEDPKAAPAMFHELSKELHFDAQTLRRRSAETLKKILHNYAFFDVSTIDRFTHRIVRTFAKDLKIPQNFEVVLDTDLLLDEAVARLVHKAGTDQKLTRVLLDFALEKIDDDRSWDITIDLFKIGKLLFNENHRPHLEKLRNKNVDDFLALKKKLVEQSTVLKKKVMTSAETALHLIEQSGLEFSDFTGGYFPKFMVKIAGGDLNIDFNAAWKQNFNDTSLYNKSASDTTKTLLDGLHPDLMIHFERIKEDFYQIRFLQNAYGNVVPLTVLNAIQQEVKTLQAERDQLSISEFNTLISEEIKNQPAPFIYERLGEKYRHYFIDEFQDTSTLQWQNLMPLIGNALESEDMSGRKGSLFMVGDAKQAIYRWRGGRAEQFLNLIGIQSNPFVVTPKVQSLPTNYRSYEEIIKFNNDFFTATSPFLNRTLYSEMFVEGNRQLYNTKKGGLVQFTFIEQNGAEDKKERYCEEVLATIRGLNEKQYGYEDICILVRSNRDGVLLADYLTQRQIPTISSESLLLNSSDKVRFLVNLLKHIADSKNLETVFDVLSFLSMGKKNRHRFIFSNLKRLPEPLKELFDLDLEHLKRISVYDGLELVIKKTCLVADSDAYITYFMDFVLEIEQKEGAGLQAVLTSWEKKKEKLSLTSPENVPAVRIMTIHKAKGLEFPVVIFPFANESLYKRMDKKMWVPLDPEEFDGFEEILINEKKEVAEYGPEAAQRFCKEEHLMELDAFNVLYVALTRAEKALFIISEKDLTRGGHKTDRYSGLFIEYLKNKGLWREDESQYSFGTLVPNTGYYNPEDQKSVDFIPTSKDRPAFRILTRSGMLWDTPREDAILKGNRTHDILGLIEKESDFDEVFAQLVQKGDIAIEEIDSLKERLRAVIRHPKLIDYYKEGNVVKNERDIMTATGRVLRPDRIVLNNGGATLIDYKTGKPNPKHKEQLYAYADALEAMGYRVDNKILVYMNAKVVAQYV